MKKAQHREFKQIDSWWLDKLPVEWSYASLRWLTKIYAGGTPDKKVESYWSDGNIPWLNSGSVNQGAIKTPSAYITQEAYENSSAKWIPAESLVMALAGQGKTKGIVAQLKRRMTCNQSMAAIVGTQKVKNRFVYWWLTSNYKNIRNLAGGENRDGLNLEMIGSIFCPLPPYNEQQKIAQFLDYETAKIDALIDEQKRLIELLKEKRQAVISHAVTKGLNPDAPMKDSGVEWLGEVPAHWDVKRLKHLGKVIGGYAFKSTDFIDDGYPVIKISNVSHLSFDWGDASFLPVNFPIHYRDYLAPKGSLVFAMTRPVISGGIKVAKLKTETNPLINQRVGFMKFKDAELADFTLLSTQSAAFLAQFSNNMTVTNQPNISSEGIEAVSIPLPPDHERTLILNYLNKLIDTYENGLSLAQHQIALLKERRSALISAAVTGKIDVRDWQPPAGSDTVDSNALVQTERHYG